MASGSRLPRGQLATAGLVLALGAGCGDQEIRGIERLPTPGTENPPGAPVVQDRGRVQVRDGALVTDKGTRLRGVTLGIDFRPDFPLERPLFDQMAHEAGLNAVHVYLESFEQEAGAHAAQADQLVELTSHAGMYLVLGVGAGAMAGSFSLERLRSFWSFYAGRYASRSHVLYEIQNLPELACDAPLAAATLAMERELYSSIRVAAPASHVALLSLIAAPSSSALKDALDGLDDIVDWSKASIAFHAEGCGSADYLPSLLSDTRARGIAALVSEVPANLPLSLTGELEAARIGWFSFQWLTADQDLQAFRSAHEAAGVTWCPDFGVWPEDAQSCSTP